MGKIAVKCEKTLKIATISVKNFKSHWRMYNAESLKLSPSPIDKNTYSATNFLIVINLKWLI